MQIFVRADRTYTLNVDETTTIASAAKQLEALTSIPQHTQLLLRSNQIVDSDAALRALERDSLLHISHRIIGGAPKKKCQKTDCTSPALRGLSCSFCEKAFCGRHRLLEEHSCGGLQDCKKQLHERNREKLESERCVASRV